MFSTCKKGAVIFKKVIKSYRHDQTLYLPLPSSKSITSLGLPDNTPYYRNKTVTEYLKDSKIQPHFLPPYNPNLNPIERLRKWMKECVVYNTYYEHFEEFKLGIFGFFSVLSTLDPESILGKCFRS